MFAMSVPGPAAIHPQPGMSFPSTEKNNIPWVTLMATSAGCMRTTMPGTTMSSALARQARWRAWCIFAGSSSISLTAQVRRRRKKRLSVSPGFMLLRRSRRERRLKNGSASDRNTQNDKLVVTRLDRLARSLRDLQNIVHTLHEREVELLVIEQAIATSSPEGKLFFNILGAIAEFETEIRKARQREGIDSALTKGLNSPFKGRPKSVDD